MGAVVVVEIELRRRQGSFALSSSTVTYHSSVLFKSVRAVSAGGRTVGFSTYILYFILLRRRSYLLYLLHGKKRRILFNNPPTLRVPCTSLLRTPPKHLPPPTVKMAKSSRASSIKTNNAALKSKVYGPVETARTDRLSAKLMELAAQPKPVRVEEVPEAAEEGMFAHCRNNSLLIRLADVPAPSKAADSTFSNPTAISIYLSCASNILTYVQ